MKRVIRTPSRAVRSDGSKEWKESRLQSEQVDFQLKRDKLSRRNTVNILVQGSNSAKLELIARIKDVHQVQPNLEERLAYRERLQIRTADAIRSFIATVQTNFLLSNDLIASGGVNINTSVPPYLNSAALKVADTLWNDCDISQWYRVAKEDHLDHDWRV